ncbi:MAG: ShlB/FhaC/HecB family hemolysin secretion/activation protein [Steroidobacteraceae bacterium]
MGRGAARIIGMIACGFLPLTEAVSADPASGAPTAPQAAAPTAAPAPAAPAPLSAAPAAPEEFFDISEIRVLGNSVLPVAAIERAVYPYAGPHKSIKDVQAARAALEQAYHGAGYGTVFVDIPEQEVGNGVVRLHATEGRLDRVRVSGVRYFSGRRILAALPAVQSGQVPQLPALQSELAAVNTRSSDRAVTPILKAGRTPGTVDLDLRVNETLPLHGGVTLNNRYTPDTSQLRSTVDLSYGNLFQDFQSVAFEYQTAPQRPANERVLSLTYLAPLGESGNLLALYAVDTNSNVAAVGSLSLLGVGQVYGVHLIRPLTGSGAWSHNLNLGGDFKDFSQTVDVPGAPPDKTPIRYVNWSITYALAEHTPLHDTTLSLAANFGVRGLPNRPAEFDFKRFGAQAGYSYLRGTLERRQALFLGTSLDARLGFQLTDAPLVSNEQFGIGGIDTVRGYLESIALGDSGATGSLELRGPSWGFRPNPQENHLMVYAFYDAGLVTILDTLPAQQARYELESLGAGVRLSAFRGLDAQLDWADPLKTVSTVRRGHSRFEFQLHYGF